MAASGGSSVTVAADVAAAPARASKKFLGADRFLCRLGCQVPFGVGAALPSGAAPPAGGVAGALIWSGGVCAGGAVWASLTADWQVLPALGLNATLLYVGPQ